MNLDSLQRSVFEAVRQPLTDDERMQRNAATGAAEQVIKPNSRLTSFERLEIYNRQYWFRILSALADDFPGLQALLGEKAFDRLALAYLNDCPSESFTLRNLGSRLENWLQAHIEYAGQRPEMALDLVRLEWAEIEAFDLATLPRLLHTDLAQLGEDPRFALQSYVRLLELQYPLDDWLVELKHGRDEDHEVASNAFEERAPSAAGKRPRLPRRKKTYVAVHRDPETLSVYFKRLDPAAYTLLRALQTGRSLSEAIAEALDGGHYEPEEFSLELRGWFENWSALGWFTRSTEPA